MLSGTAECGVKGAIEHLKVARVCSNVSTKKNDHVEDKTFCWVCEF